MKTTHITTSIIEKRFRKLSFARLIKSHRLGEEYSQVEMAKKLGLLQIELIDSYVVD